jgi:ferric-dicitrate binding protein FerR (iron transport regulator)
LKDWKKNHLNLYEELRQGTQLSQQFSLYDQADAETAYKEIEDRIFFKKRRNLIIRIGSIAASIIVLLCIGTFVALQEQQDSNTESIQWTHIMPEKEKATITTSDNQIILLDAERLIVKNNQLIDGEGDGKLHIALKEKEEGPSLNKLDVPAGGEHELTLADGSSIKVNSATEFWFPTNFGKETRHVRMQGEAYFQVEANQEHPFIVHLTDEIKVKVTGTTFNINSYKEESHISIALEKGSIDILQADQLLASITPGQLFTYQKETGEYQISSSDISHITDWTSDTFIFRDESIETIMRKLSRWYNVEISLDKEIKDIRYTGILSRKQPLHETLEALRLTNELDFDIKESNKVTVTEIKKQP